MQFAADAVAVHTAAEPDPDVQALANDSNVEVLVFKMAVATGFDAPRAFTLCALRPVVDANFGLQIIGRIMRVHALLQSLVLWWTRNLPRPNAVDDWSVRIVLPESGRGYYPDFVVCIDDRKHSNGIGLAETKERTETEDSSAKSRTEHREYGRALMVSYDADADRFIRVEFAPELGRNRAMGPLRPGDLI